MSEFQKIVSAENGAQRPFEMGLECLIEVAKVHGIHLSRHQILHDNQIKPEIFGTDQLLVCAKRAGLKGHHLKLGWKELVKIKHSLPAIIYMKDGEPYILTCITNNDDINSVTLIDPLLGEKASLHIDRAKLEDIWDGTTLILKKNYQITDESKPFGISLILSLVFRERRILRDVVISALVLSVLTLAPILFFRLMTDRVLLHHSLNTFTVLCIALTICIFSETLFAAVRRALMLHLTARIDVKLSTLIYERVIRQPVDLFETTPVGIIARNMSEATKIRAFVSDQILGTLLDGICVLVFLPVMFLYSPILTFVVLGCCSLIIVWTMCMLPAYAKRSGAYITAEGARGSFIIQTIQGIRTIKSLALEPTQLTKYDALVANSAKCRMREANLANLIQSSIIPLERFMISGTLAIGVYIAMTSTDTSAVAEIFVFLLLSQRVVGPMRQMAQLAEQYEKAKTSVDLVSAIVNGPSEQANNEKGVRQPLIGHVQFANVRFQYRGASSPALESVNFEVSAGTTLGIMGRSGSGKTTVTRLLQRLHNDYEGLIKIDGIDVREYALDHLRSNLGVVLQDNFLFTGSIRENIAAAKVSANFEEIVKAARLAGAEEFIDRLPRGYETQINEGSTNLSGGQRQRIAIARALLTNPRILILDEATSALDPDSESIVNQNLKRIAEGRTVIVISHRLSSLVSSDAILVLEKGKVHDIGRHAELLTRCDIYRELWNQQNNTEYTKADTRLRLVN